MKKFSYEYFRDLAQILSFLVLTFSLGAMHFSKKFTIIIIGCGFFAIVLCAIFMTLKEVSKNK